MIFTPIPLASKPTVSGADVEANLRAITELIGGSAYSGGAPVTYGQGQLSLVNISKRLRVSNAMKYEPYSLHAVQIHIPKMVSGGGGVEFSASWLGEGESSEILGATFAYSRLSMGTDATGLVQLRQSSPAYSANSTDFVRLLPATAKTLSLTDFGGTVNYVAGVPDIRVLSYVSSIAGGSGYPELYDAVVTILLKTKHVA